MIETAMTKGGENLLTTHQSVQPSATLGLGRFSHMRPIQPARAGAKRNKVQSGNSPENSVPFR